MSGELQFDPESHVYTIDGKNLPSVTTIIKEAGLIDSTWFTEAAMMRGIYVHQATELLDKNDLDESSLDPILAPYVDAYKRFLDDTGFYISYIEKIVYNATYGYAGRLDRLGKFPTDKIESIIDIKTGKPEKWHGVQLAAYGLCLGNEPRKRFGLYLSDTGNYRLERYTDRQDMQIFLACLTIYKFKEATCSRQPKL